MSFPTVTVEVAFTTGPDATVPNYVDISSKVLSISIRRGRQYELDQIQASTCDIRLDNGDRRFDPTYTHSPFYPYVLPMRKVRVSATWLGVQYFLFTGYAERWPIQWEAPAWGSASVTAVDGLSSLAQAQITGSFVQQLAGARVAAVLSAAQWASSTPAAGYWTLGTSQLGSTAVLSFGIATTVVDAGQSQVQAVTIADTDNVTALSHINDMEAAERGVFFIDGQGRAVFQDRHHRFNEASSVTFTDGSRSSTRLPYQDLVPELDVARIVNNVTVTATGGVAQTATDAMSVANYRRISLTLTPPLLTDTEALNQANFEVKLHKDPRLRFDTLTLKPQGNDNTWPHALGRELGDKVTVERTPASRSGIVSETITQPSFIEAVQHDIAPGQWTTSFQLSPADVYANFFALNTAQLGAPASAALAY